LVEVAMPPKEQRTKAGDTRQIEYRAADVETRADDGGVAGYVSTHWVVDSYGTAFHPSAWDKSVRERGDKLFLLYQHWPDAAIGKLDNVAVDGTGLKHDSTIVDDGAEGTVALKRLRAGVPFGHSVGFRTIRERPATVDDPLIFSENSPAWSRENPDMVYVIEEAKLYEGSLVTFPANDLAVITSVRSDLELQTLSTTLDALRNGRLTPAQRDIIAELSAAWQAAPELHPQPPRTDAQARADREAALNLMLADIGLTVDDLLTPA
jgi:HK97 family phage prohead protease